MFYIPTDTK